MKTTLLIPLLLILVASPAFGQLSDRTGLVTRLDVETGGDTFEVQIVSNFAVSDHVFDKENNKLTIFIQSDLDNNLGEIIIPQSLLSGNFSFYLNDVEYHPKIKSNDKISFITMNFTGTGNNKIDVIGTNSHVGMEDTGESVIEEPSEGGGCLIATAAYGTELAPQVQQLREIRDNKLLKSESGKLFMKSFNEFYYSFSPVIADYERANPIFKESVKLFLTPMISSLSVMNHAQEGNELQVLGFGVGVIAMNIGLYFVAPIVIIERLRK